jgi:hypothetical protein
MSKKTLICVVVGWVLLRIVGYYFVPHLIVILLGIVLSFGLIIISIVQIVKLVKERKALTWLRVTKVLAFLILFYLTFNHRIFNRLIEQGDWLILYGRRTDIVDKVKQQELNPNVNWSDWICQLPYEFPVVSNAGNEIGIARDSDNEAVTVTFWVFRNDFGIATTCFVYTNDQEQMARFDKLIARDPENNWKIESNWYRTFSTHSR